MKILEFFVVFCIAILVVIAGSLVAAPFVFAGRVLPWTEIEGRLVSGVDNTDKAGVASVLNEAFKARSITTVLRGHNATVSSGDLGFSLNEQTLVAQMGGISSIWPISLLEMQMKPDVQVDTTQLRTRLSELFTSQLKSPQNATLQLEPNNTFSLISGQSGETVDVMTLTQRIQQEAMANDFSTPISLDVATAEPEVTPNEVTRARELATQLMNDGLYLTARDITYDVKPFTIRRLLQFKPQTDPADANNIILGVGLDPTGLAEYLTTTLVPEINQPAQNARFSVVDGKVEQFAVPEKGYSLDIDQSVVAINTALQHQQATLALVVAEVDPEITDVADMESLGLKEIIASGVTDFKGSPKNRIKNITVGTSRYQGLLIAPNEEFSFDKFLGPVDGEHGFAPELVIKQNVTTPEFGGGLCQVSTTAFRAAVQAGLKITARRNHAYAVHYYGPPGFDATIYPPYTDLRFLNNTPGYILIQTKIEGTKLTFDFWGTSDGREVAIDGPHQYNRHPDGSVKATLKQTVTKDGQVLIQDTFYSNYKSPLLFPKVTAANAPTP